MLDIRVTSGVGIGLESLCCGAQKFRDRREIPITFVWVDVPEVDREVRQQRLYVQTLLIPPLQTGHRERMAKRHEAGTPSTGGRDDDHTLTQSSKPVVQGKILQMLPLLRHEKSVRQPIVVQACSLLMVGAKALRRAGMEWDNP